MTQWYCQYRNPTTQHWR